MCQLTFANLNNARLNSLYLYLQWMENTDTTNRDGFGIYCNNYLNKSGMSARSVNNFGDWFLKSVKSTKPVIGHVRLATATKNVKEVSEETSHPFEGEKLVLAHNGVLDFKEDKNYDNHKGINVDSLIFLRELESRYDGTNFVSAIQETMGLFQGTFAFLIYSKLEDAYYIIRGKTKKLHACIVDVKVGSKNWSGFVINTEILSLEKALIKLKAIGEITSGGEITLSKVGELKEEKIYKVENNDLIEVGEIKEEERRKSFFTGQEKNTTTNTTSLIGTGATSHNNLLNPKNLSATAKFLADFLRLNHLTPYELDYLLYLTYEKGFFACNEEEIKKVVEWYNESVKEFNTDSKKEIWDALVAVYGGNPLSLYENYDIKFPYVMNATSKLQAVLNKEYGVE